jgi:hypothetical protein
MHDSRKVGHDAGKVGDGQSVSLYLRCDLGRDDKDIFLLDPINLCEVLRELFLTRWGIAVYADIGLSLENRFLKLFPDPVLLPKALARIE